MTVIVATRDAMYSDSICTVGDVHFPAIKIYRHKKHLVGCAGDVPAIERFLRWYTGDRKKSLDMGEGAFNAVVVNRHGIWDFTCSFPDKVLRDFHGCGVGWPAAQAALLCGKSPREAIEIACQVSHLCGLPVQEFRL